MSFEKASIIVEETNDFDALKEMMLRHDIEFPKTDPEPTKVLNLWKAVAPDGKLVGGCILVKRAGEFLIKGISVEPEYRRQKIASRMLQTAILEVMLSGGKDIYLVAKEPLFFEAHNFEEIGEDEVPFHFSCSSCNQMNVTCHPKIMHLQIGAGMPADMDMGI